MVRTSSDTAAAFVISSADDFLTSRRKSLSSSISDLRHLEQELSQRSLWNNEDSRWVALVTRDADNYLAAIANRPQDFFRSHKDMALFSGPSISVPVGPASWSLMAYIFAVDARIRLLQALYTLRLERQQQLHEETGWRYFTDPSITIRERASYAYGNKNLRILRFEDRAAHEAYLEAFERELLKAIEVAGFNSPQAGFDYHALSNQAREVSGLINVRFAAAPWCMTMEQAIDSISVAPLMPSWPPAPAPLAGVGDEQVAEWHRGLDAYSAAITENSRVSDASWRELTVTEVKGLVTKPI